MCGIPDGAVDFDAVINRYDVDRDEIVIGSVYLHTDCDGVEEVSVLPGMCWDNYRLDEPKHFAGLIRSLEDAQRALFRDYQI